jgi:hypothetical protein
MTSNAELIRSTLPDLAEDPGSIGAVGLQSLLSAYGDLDTTTAAFMNQISTLLTTRVQILGQTGALLQILGLGADGLPVAAAAAAVPAATPAESTVQAPAPAVSN